MDRHHLRRLVDACARRSLRDDLGHETGRGRLSLNDGRPEPNDARQVGASSDEVAIAHLLPGPQNGPAAPEADADHRWHESRLGGRGGHGVEPRVDHKGQIPRQHLEVLAQRVAFLRLIFLCLYRRRLQVNAHRDPCSVGGFRPATCPLHLAPGAGVETSGLDEDENILGRPPRGEHRGRRLGRGLRAGRPPPPGAGRVPGPDLRGGHDAEARYVPEPRRAARHILHLAEGPGPQVLRMAGLSEGDLAQGETLAYEAGA
mmetsp:Transcript_92001/g.233930  ORF Transcript_92001/g.233930 Transcript_92001/m.233930 type:complete len:259 (+) Transcript_92001:108-884(+)